MGYQKPKKPNYDPKDDQKQDQDQSQDQKQDQLQAQLQGQAQGQAQGQGQFQFAVQSVDTKVENDNENDNKNENSNSNDNKIDNKVENSVENKVENSVDNKIDNDISNNIENKVDVKVNVDVDLDIDGSLGGIHDNDYIDVDTIDIKDIEGSVVSAEAVYQAVSGGGSAYNIDQVNNLADNDFLWKAELKNDSKFEVDASGGDLKFDGKIDVEIGDFKGNANTVGDMVTTSADGIANVEAFTQNIVMGANIQFNNIEIGNETHTTLDDPTG